MNILSFGNVQSVCSSNHQNPPHTYESARVRKCCCVGMGENLWFDELNQLRHSCATLWLNAGAPVLSVQFCSRMKSRTPRLGTPGGMMARSWRITTAP